MVHQKDWSAREIDMVYNGSAAAGAITTTILDQTTGFNRNKGFARLLTTVFTGVGIGGCLAYVYLYFQGVYDVDFVPRGYSRLEDADEDYTPEQSEEPGHYTSEYESDARGYESGPSVVYEEETESDNQFTLVKEETVPDSESESDGSGYKFKVRKFPFVARNREHPLYKI